MRPRIEHPKEMDDADRLLRVRVGNPPVAWRRDEPIYGPARDAEEAAWVAAWHQAHPKAAAHHRWFRWACLLLTLALGVWMGTL